MAKRLDIMLQDVGKNTFQLYQDLKQYASDEKTGVARIANQLFDEAVREFLKNPDLTKIFK